MHLLESPCILIVDDERQNRKTLAELLEKDFQVLVAKNSVQPWIDWKRIRMFIWCDWTW